MTNQLFNEITIVHRKNEIIFCPHFSSTNEQTKVGPGGCLRKKKETCYGVQKKRFFNHYTQLEITDKGNFN